MDDICGRTQATWFDLVSSEETNRCDSAADCHKIEFEFLDARGICWMATGKSVSAEDLAGLRATYFAHQCGGEATIVDCIGGDPKCIASRCTL